MFNVQCQTYGSKGFVFTILVCACTRLQVFIFDYACIRVAFMVSRNDKVVSLCIHVYFSRFSIAKYIGIGHSVSEHSCGFHAVLTFLLLLYQTFLFVTIAGYVNVLK